LSSVNGKFATPAERAQARGGLAHGLDQARSLVLAAEGGEAAEGGQGLSALTGSFHGVTWDRD
jgi:hypothetical protein